MTNFASGFEKYLSTFNHQDIDVKALLKDTKGMTGAHLKEMVMMAYMDALSNQTTKKHQNYTRQFGEIMKTTWRTEPSIITTKETTLTPPFFMDKAFFR